MHNACEETSTEGMYGPWMIVSRKRQGQKGTRSVHNTGGTSSTTEFSSRHFDPKISDKGNTFFGGPSNVLPQRERYFKDKTISNEEKMKWASKIPNPSPLYPTKLQETMRAGPVEKLFDGGSSKRFEVQQEHDTKKGPSTRKQLSFPLSVKGKKAFARGTSTGTLHSHAVTHQLSGLAEKLTSLSHFPPISTSHGSNHTGNPSFEFSTSSKAEGSSKNGNTEKRNFESLEFNNKDLLQASEIPTSTQDGRGDELALATVKEKNEGGTIKGEAKENMEVQSSALSSISKGESCVDDQMVLEEGNGVPSSS
nr:hypothetical protein CFP56_48945 [Quercus suber]